MAQKIEKDPGNTLHMKHDEFVRAYLSDKETAISFFQNYLPSEITDHINFKTLSMPKDSFISKKMARYYSDILYEVHLKDTQAFIYLLIEHKSKKDTFVGFQLLKYCIQIWELYLKHNKNSKKLPIILPMVIYHGEAEWGVNTDFISLVDVPENMQDAIQDYIPNFKYNLQDISHISDGEIQGNILLQIMLMTLKYSRKTDFAEKLPGIFELFMKIMDDRRGIEYVEIFLEYLSHQLPNDYIDVVDNAIPDLIEKGGAKMVTIAQSWFRSGKREGKKEGKQEGKLEGKLEGKIEGKLEVIRQMLADNMPLDLISKYTGYPKNQILELVPKTIQL